MSISKPTRGRPSRRFILEQVDLGMDDLKRAGGLPSPLENAEIWRDIWFEEAHNSTAIEGNTLTLRDVRVLLEQDRPVGNKDLREYLEVMAYAKAAEWVYGQGRAPAEWSNEDAILLTELHHLHHQTVGPPWEFFPPDGLDPEEGPGSFRRHEIAPFSGGMKPPSFTDVPAAISDWLAVANAAPLNDEHLIVTLARSHSEFERIHPFRDGNGRVGRLVMNLLLVRRGYPPAIIRNRTRSRYLVALRRADAGDPWPLAELLGRAVKDSLDRFLLPNLAEPLRLVPLSALADERVTVRALRAAADRGRLRAVQDQAGRWLSTRRWVDDYVRTRKVGRPPKAEGRPRISAIGVVQGPGDVADNVDRHLRETRFGK